MSETPNSRIVALHTENVMRLRAVDMTPPPHLVVVAGDNDQGKSSLLTSIEMALQGADAIPSMPVRKGQQKAVVELDLGELIVRRTVTAAGNTTLTVKAKKDGAVLKTPQDILSKLIGSRSFDPMEFLSLKPGPQAEVLRKIAGLDFTIIESERTGLYSERTAVNRLKDSAHAKVTANPPCPDAPEEIQSAVSILQEQEKAATINRENGATRERFNQAQKDFELADRAMGEALRRYEQAKERAAAANKRVIQLEKECEGLKDVDVSGFRAQLEALETSNKKVRQNQAHREALKQYKEAEAKSNALTRQIDALDSKRNDMVLNAKYPIAGLGFTDVGEVAFNGIPFAQASTSQQLKVSVSIAAALNPGLRVMLIRNGNDLGEKNMAALADMAREMNVQIWIERVSTAGEVAVVIEDGTAVNPKPEPKGQGELIPG